MIKLVLYRIITIFLLTTSLIGAATAQEYEYTEEEIYRSPIKKILNQFSFTITTGYGRTNYKHSLSGFYYAQSQTQQLLINDDGNPPGPLFDGVSTWLNNPVLNPVIPNVDSLSVPFPPINNPVLNPLLQQQFLILKGDSLGMEYTGKGGGIPLFLSLRYNYKKFRIGFGFMFERQSLKKLESNYPDLGVRDYVPNFKSSLSTRYFLTLGYRFYDFWDYSFAGEVQIGKFNGGKNFKSPLISRGTNLNFGISIEKNLSEYFRVIFKPSYDLNNYTIEIPGTGKSIKHNQPTVFYQLGISITFPEIPRSPIKSDHVQLKHVITDPATGQYKEVRGQPIYKRQNPKVGENHRKLFRDKRKNKKKLNPY